MPRAAAASDISAARAAAQLAALTAIAGAASCEVQPSMLPDILLLLAVPAAGRLAGSPPLGATAVLADGKAAFDRWARTTPMDNNDWTGSTFAIGLMEYYKATKAVGASDESALAYATRWAKHYDYQLYNSEGAAQIGLPPGKHIADHQLCAATYIELFKLDGNASHLDDVKTVLNAEVAAAEATSNYWSWVDALFMAMSVYSRLGNVTGVGAYASKQFMNFNASALMPADAKNRGVAEGDGKTFGFWNASDRLFYRDDRFIFSRTYWGRGNGWAISALVAALEHGEASDPHRNRYTQVYTELAAELLKLQGSDGAWHASLLDVSGYPVPETTGTASFAYGLVRGDGELFKLTVQTIGSPELVPPGLGGQQSTAVRGYVCACSAESLELAHLCCSALRWFGWQLPAGRCALRQISSFCPSSTRVPIHRYIIAIIHSPFVVFTGAAPENNFNSTSTSNFCVGQFLLAVSQVSRLSTT